MSANNYLLHRNGMHGMVQTRGAYTRARESYAKPKRNSLSAPCGRGSCWACYKLSCDHYCHRRNAA